MTFANFTVSELASMGVHSAQRTIFALVFMALRWFLPFLGVVVSASCGIIGLGAVPRCAKMLTKRGEFAPPEETQVLDSIAKRPRQTGQIHPVLLWKCGNRDSLICGTFRDED